jgi:hypothetical protein
MRRQSQSVLEIETAILLDGEAVLPRGGAANIVEQPLLNLRLWDEAIEHLSAR